MPETTTSISQIRRQTVGLAVVALHMPPIPVVPALMESGVLATQVEMETQAQLESIKPVVVAVAQGAQGSMQSMAKAEMVAQVPVLTLGEEPQGLMAAAAVVDSGTTPEPVQVSVKPVEATEATE